MDAKRICPNCHAEVKGKFCTKCGAKYQEPVQEKAIEKAGEAPFKPLKEAKAPEAPEAMPRAKEAKPETGRSAPIFRAITEPKPAKPEEKSALAKGLPEWTIEPPQVVVRRKRR